MAAAKFTVQLGLGYLLILPFWLAAIGWLSGRILGIRLGRWRAGVAALVGWVAGTLATALIVGDTNISAWLLVPLVVFFGVLATLPVAIVLDVITRSGRPPRERRRNPVRAVRAAVSPLGRFREILVNPRYANAAALESPDFARRLRLMLEESGGMFVKFGQIASTRTDLLPRIALSAGYLFAPNGSSNNSTAGSHPKANTRPTTSGRFSLVPTSANTAP